MKDSDEVQDIWKEYTEDLYDKNNKPQYKIMHYTAEDNKGPFILFSEFEAALNELKWKVRSKGELLKH